MKQEINLEELLNEISNINLDEDGNRIYYLWEVKKFAKVLCGKLLDLAAENAETGEFFVFGNSDDEDRISYYDLNSLECKVDENSILQIKDWIK